MKRSLKFSLPFIDQDIKFWKYLENNYSSFIEEIYFPSSQKEIHSGRPRQPDENLFSFLLHSGLPKNLLINPIFLEKSLKVVENKLITEIRNISSTYKIDRITLKDLSLAKIVKSTFPDIQITASVLMQVNNPQQIEYLNSYIDSLVLDTSIVRNLEAIKAIRKEFTGKIKIIVNEGCLPGCPYRIQHFYEMTNDNLFPESLCLDLLEEKPWLRMKSAWILPQHLHFYHGLYDVVKISGRITLRDPAKYMKVFRGYLNGEDMKPNEIGCGPAGMIDDIPVTDDFFLKSITCRQNCLSCHQCKDYFENHKSPQN